MVDDRSGGGARVILDILLGVVVAAVAWGAIDIVAGQQSARFRLSPGPVVWPAIWLLLIGGLGTAVLALSPRSFLSAAGLMFVGVAIGVLGLWLPPRPLILVFLRGANEPAVLVLTGAWLVLGLRWWRMR